MKDIEQIKKEWECPKKHEKKLYSFQAENVYCEKCDKSYDLGMKKYETKKPKLLMNGHSDEMQTPEVAIKPLLPYIKKDWTIWESAWGGGSLAGHFKKHGFKVIGSKETDFLDENFKQDFDCVITNPPYSLKEEFLEKCYKLEKPFALLMPLTALEGKKRGELYNKYGIQLIIPNKRINFITPSGKGSGAWFQVAWFTHGLKLPRDLNFVEN